MELELEFLLLHQWLSVHTRLSGSKNVCMWILTRRNWRNDSTISIVINNRWQDDRKWITASAYDWDCWEVDWQGWHNATSSTTNDWKRLPEDVSVISSTSRRDRIDTGRSTYRNDASQDRCNSVCNWCNDWSNSVDTRNTRSKWNRGSTSSTTQKSTEKTTSFHLSSGLSRGCAEENC